MPVSSTPLILLRGGGDLGSGVAHRLHRAGFALVITELRQPLAIRRAVAFAEAMYSDTITVEGVTARYVSDPESAHAYLTKGDIPVIEDRDGAIITQLRPDIVVDARVAKKKLDTRLTDAPLVIALGPGFTAGVDCHAVIETNRGHHLGRVLWEGAAQADTQVPEAVQGQTMQRVVRAPSTGIFHAQKHIGDAVQRGEIVASVNDLPLKAPFDGVVRGILYDGLRVTSGLKVGDIDPRGIREYCFTISDKARALGGGVLEAVMTWRTTNDRRPTTV